MSTPPLPPPPLGVLGAGQLGRMLALAGAPMNLRLRLLDPSPLAPVAGLGELLTASYEDEAALARLAECPVVTYEFESVPVAAARRLAERTQVYPPPEALEVAQDRLLEKTRFQQLGIPTPAFQAVDSLAELEAAVSQLGLPAVLKTRRLGYDGKGQVVLQHASQCAAAFAALGGVPLLLEQFMPFQRELSLLAVRSTSGETRCYPLVDNQHEGGILRCSRAPASGLTPALEQQALGYAERLLGSLRYVGVLALELFDVQGTLYANEIAPRVHNSGHWTIEGARTSQFENHLRAVLGLPLGDTATLGPCAMLNAVGGLPGAAAVLAVPDAHLHDYAKAPRRGRKVGHVTVRAPDAATLDARLAQLEPLVPFQR